MTKEEMQMKLLDNKISGWRAIQPDSLLEIAIDCYTTAKDVGPFDPAYSIFINKARDYEKVAYFKETNPNC